MFLYVSLKYKHDFRFYVYIFIRYGEIVDINLIRHKETGKPKGYCFICYEDQRSTILAIDNFNGITVSSSAYYLYLYIFT